MLVRFPCPLCDAPGRIDSARQRDWQCPHCGHRLSLAPADSPQPNSENGSICPICHNEELYKKKGFPHWLGLSILAGACLAFLVFHSLYRPYWAWIILLGSALFDGILYLWVADVVVCYRCGAHISGITPLDSHKPYELVIAERYRQTRLRQQQTRH